MVVKADQGIPNLVVNIVEHSRKQEITLIGDDSQRFMEELRFASMFATLERQT